MPREVGRQTKELSNAGWSNVGTIEWRDLRRLKTVSKDEEVDNDRGTDSRQRLDETVLVRDDGGVVNDMFGDSEYQRPAS